MLTGKQRSYLKGIANSIQPILQIGKGGINENVICQFDEALEARELIKATVLRNSEDDARTACEEIAGLTGAEIVQVIGSRFVLYRESKNNKVINLP
ncbi:MAG TPA: ribosome assembly RNA-binding protein YhbY [Clostridiales bacterium]|nr:ribosome assembly RNA-binding protein YhbY [Clostridiales bacterium]